MADKIKPGAVTPGDNSRNLATGFSGQVQNTVGQTVGASAGDPPAEGRERLLDIPLKRQAIRGSYEDPGKRETLFGSASATVVAGLGKLVEVARESNIDTSPSSAREDGSAIARPSMRRASEIQPERVEWLWPGRLPRGKIAFLEGMPSAGKTTIAIDIIARLSTGQGFPDGAECMPTNCLFLVSEDGIGDTLVPRLVSAGGDGERVWFMDAVEDAGKRRPFSIPDDLPMLREEIEAKGIGLIVIDPLSGFLSGRADQHKEGDVRRALMPLADLAQQTGVTILGIRHFSKAPGGPALTKGIGSIGFVAAARCVMVVGSDPSSSDRRVLAISKNNLAPLASSFSYSLENDDSVGCARVVWHGSSALSANDLVEGKVETEKTSAVDRAAIFLEEALQGGRRAVREVEEEAQREGIALKTLRRAKERLKINATPGGFGSSWTWSLPYPVPIVSDGQDGQDWSSGENSGVPCPAPLADRGKTARDENDREVDESSSLAHLDPAKEGVGEQLAFGGMEATSGRVREVL